MTHTAIADAARAVTIQAGAVVSKVIYRDELLDVTVFGFDASEGLTEHQASRATIVQVLEGKMRFTVDGQEQEMRPGSWVHMVTGAPHSLVAEEPTVMLLILLRADG